MGKLISALKDIACGAVMAVADSVPGVSGATIAYLIGFYEKFVASVSDLLLGPWDKKKAALPFVIKLAIGWACCFAVCAVVLTAFFEANIYALSSLFLGFTLLAIPIIVWEEREALKGRLTWLITAAIGILVAPLLVTLNGFFGVSDITHLTLPLIILLLVAGVLALAVMVLPGISGSTMLLIFGLYVPLVTGVSALLHGNFSTLPALIIFAVGAIIGLALCSKLVRFCFAKYRKLTVGAIIGLLIGSLYAIAKGPETMGAGTEMLSLSTFSIGCFILGIGIMLGLEWIKIIREKKLAAKTE